MTALKSPGSNDEPKRAYVVDDDTTFRKSMLLLLETAGWQALGFPGVHEFLERCEHLQPGALLLDIRMPTTSGLELLENDGLRLVNFATIIVTGHGDVDTAVRALKSGAVDFIEKPFDAQDLLAMLDRGYSNLLARIESIRRERDAEVRVQRLSARELEVLQGLLAGGSHKHIARHLNLSDRTVEMYRQNMVRKLGARGTTEALHFGMLAKISPANLN